MFEKVSYFILEKAIPYLILNWQYSLVALFVFFIALRATTHKTKHKTKHQFNVWVANKHLKKLKNIEGVPQRFGFCRKVNPYIFEEMVLTSFKRSGYKIKRSPSYSNDGGIDGRVRINGAWCFIQTKRYRSHIKKAHVTDFRMLCEKKKNKGVFVHCGRTSKNTWIELGDIIQIISGDILIKLLVDNKF